MYGIKKDESVLVIKLRGVVDENSVMGAEEAILKANRESIVFEDEIFGTPKEYVKANKIERIILDINSPGGYVFYGQSLINTILNSEIPVDAVVHNCASMASLIAVACRKRYAFENSSIMFHDISSAGEGTLENMQHELAQAKKERQIIDNWTCGRTKIDPKKLSAHIKKQKNWYMDTKEALELEVIHEILPSYNY